MKAIICDLCKMQDDFDAVSSKWTEVNTRLFLAEQVPEADWKRFYKNVCPNCWAKVDQFLFSIVNTPEF